MLLRFVPIVAVALTACAAAPPPSSQSAHDPSSPGAEETPVLTASAATTAPTATGAPASGDGADAGVVYACPMHPEVTATEPGHRCPKCGMALVPRQSKP